jgi:tetratricopeptide (TPR) repeat protein
MMCGLVIVAGLLAPAPVGADRARARAWVEEGARLQASGKPDEALALYQRAMAADPDYLLAYQAAAPLWLSRGQDDVVIERFERITLRHPDYPFGWYTLAYAYRRAGRLEHATLAYQTCIDLRPDDAEPYFGLAMVHKKAGKPADALAAFERYAELETRPARAAYVNQARREIAALREQVVETRAAEAVSTREAGAVGPLAAIRALLAQGRYASAAALAERTAPQSAGDGLALLMIRAEIAAGQGRYENARILAWAALVAAPAHPAVHALLRRLHREQARGAERSASGDHATE